MKVDREELVAQAVGIAQGLDPEQMGSLVGAFQHAHKAGYTGEGALSAASQLYYGLHDGPVPDRLSGMGKFKMETRILEQLLREIVPAAEPRRKPRKKAASGSDNSVRDLPQRAKVADGEIAVSSYVGRQKAAGFTFPLAAWERAESNADTFNPAYNKSFLLRGLTQGLDYEPGGPCQADRIRDSMIRAIDKAVAASRAA